MLGVKLIFLTFVAVKVTSNEITTQCSEFDDFPATSNTTPSILADLKVELGEKYMLIISWAINIDASIKFLKGTRLIIGGEEYHCEYNPPLDKANLTGSKQKWFNYSTKASIGSNVIQAANLPLLRGVQLYKFISIMVHAPKQSTVKPETTPSERDQTETVPSLMIQTSAVVGCLAILVILTCCYFIYKSFRGNYAISFGFKRCPTSPAVPVPVLVVYPAENSAFQRAVLALVDFLQLQCGCSVAVDIWQQGKIAELGPMRWLAEQTHIASRVLIICPQMSSSSSHSIKHSLPAPSIPAAAQDLYPLVVNMVASHAKSSKDFSKFWVVQLGEQPMGKSSANLAPELRACKTFCVMKDLKKLCRSLHDPRRGTSILAQILSSGKAYSEQSVAQLREAVKEINGHQSSIFR